MKPRWGRLAAIGIVAAVGAVGGLLLSRGGPASGPSGPSTASSTHVKLVASRARWSLPAPVADARNCRILFIGPSRQPTGQIGSSGDCAHDPPRSIAYPNGDTPLANGDLLVSEVNGSYLDEISRSGKLVWSAHLPTAYPSDPQQLGHDRYLVADYSRPGGIYEFDRGAYHPPSGRWMLDHPSLAERLPNGLIATNDDYRDRVVIIDPRKKHIVWQYGRTDRPGTGPDRLKILDGFDLLESGVTTPTHPDTG